MDHATAATAAAGDRSQQVAASGARVTAADLSERELLKAVVNGSPTALTVVAADGTALLWNPAAEALFGWSASEVVGRPLPTVDQASEAEFDSIRRAALAGQPVVELETERRHRNGDRVPVAISTVPVHDPSGRAVAVLGVFRDLARRRAIQSELYRQTHRDELTGLLSRRGLVEALAEYAPGKPRHGLVMELNLDHFGDLNEGLDRAAGDEILHSFAERLRHAVRPSDLVARLETDLFAVVMTRVAPGRAVQLVTRVLGHLDYRYTIGSQEVMASVTAGAAACTSHTPPDEALRRAGVALGRAKATGSGGWHILDEAEDQAFADRVELAAQLAGAAGRGELCLHFQPIVSAASSQVIGAEALVRWAHPDRGLLGPDQFIPLAEEMGSISTVDRWVLKTACKAAMNRPGASGEVPQMTVAVNVSASQLQGRGFAAEVAAALQQTGLAPARLQLEVTESVLSADAEEAAMVLGELRGLGVILAIDDFGTGNSSLTALQRFPFQILKIDQSFVSGIGRRPGDETIVAATIGLAHGLGLHVVAEGVETEEQREFLTTHGCEGLQGFLIARPQPEFLQAYTTSA